MPPLLVVSVDRRQLRGFQYLQYEVEGDVAGVEVVLGLDRDGYVARNLLVCEQIVDYVADAARGHYPREGGSRLVYSIVERVYELFVVRQRGADLTALADVARRDLDLRVGLQELILREALAAVELAENFVTISFQVNSPLKVAQLSSYSKFFSVPRSVGSMTSLTHWILK